MVLPSPPSLPPSLSHIAFEDVPLVVLLLVVCNIDISQTYGDLSGVSGRPGLPLCVLTPAPTAKGDLAVSSPCEESVAPLVLGCVVFSWVTDTKMQ